jgi:hypothetical protein
MRSLLITTLAIALLASRESVTAQRRPVSRPQLEGTWNGATRTPLERPVGFEHRATFTREEAAEYKRTASERFRSGLRTEADRLTQSDIDDTFVETEVYELDRLRTSLIVDPPAGRLPDLLPSARARIAMRPKRLFEDPETFGLAERCLLGNFGQGGSLASPPMVPSQVIPGYYKIVQTDAVVMIFTEWIHDARIIRMNSAHLPSGIRKWLGDSVGVYDGSTLVVDTTNFRADTHNLNSSERLHVVEQFTRIDPKTLRYRATVDDPDTWATAWTAEWLFKATDIQLYSVDCHEGNAAIELFLRGARFEERERARPR